MSHLEASAGQDKIFWTTALNDARVRGFPRSYAGTTGAHGVPAYEQAESFSLRAGEELSVEFEIPDGHDTSFVGFGMWFLAPKSSTCSVVRENATDRYTLSTPDAPNWSKVGSMWVSNGAPSAATVSIRAAKDSSVAIWSPGCGVIEHDHLDDARRELLKNMYQFSPEAHFYSVEGDVTLFVPRAGGRVAEATVARIPLKSCNRCGRFLPINLANEQKHLSFSNHCKAANRRPCKHSLIRTALTRS